ncbi:MAG: tRNA pseudouridine(54/55) synthase Pus10 [Candidatus Hodarchaeales archaeon]|jgi:tRNA pseudouridine synthase 10
MESQLYTIASSLLENIHLCNSCLGRQFGNLLTGLSNFERGEAIKLFFLMDWEIKDRISKIGTPNKSSLISKDFPIGLHSVNRYYSDKEAELTPCAICKDLLSVPFLKSLAEDAVLKVKEYEFTTFLVGSRFPAEIVDKEDRFRGTYGLEYGESIKADFNREVGKILSKLLPSALVEFKTPEIVFTFDLVREEILLKSNPLFILGRYKKLERGIPQSKWFCRKCRGNGCEYCNHTGKMYSDSVEEYATFPFFEAAQGISSKFHGSGREDIDARMLGTGRPFVIEISEPKVRNFNFDDITEQIRQNSNGKVEVTIEGLTNRSKVREIKTRSSRNSKAYRAVIKLETILSDDKSILINIEEEFTNLLIKQRTPIRVSHRRADKIRIRRVGSFKIENAEEDTVTVLIVCEGGLYVKELMID